MLCYTCCFFVLSHTTFRRCVNINRIRLIEIDRKILPSSRTSLRLTFNELNEPVNVFYPPRSAWAATWLLSPWQRLWKGNMETVNTGHHPGRGSTFVMPPKVHRSCLYFANNTLHCITSELFDYNFVEPCNDEKFTINSLLQILKEPVKDTIENTTSCNMQAHIITILTNKLLVFSNATTSKTVTLRI